jgi:PAS domain S-box-containing protein
MGKYFSPSEKDFQAAVEISLDGFAILKSVRKEGKVVDFVWTYANPVCHRLMRTKDLVGKRLSQTQPVKTAGILTNYIQVVETGQPYEGGIAYQTAKVSGWWYQSVVKLGDGIAVTLRDITERRLWEESLKQSEARFRVITQSNMVGLFFWDEKGAILDANEAFLKMLGYSRGEFFQQPREWRDLTPAEFWTLDEKAMAEMKDSGACTPFEKELFHQDGRLVSVLLGAARLEAINYEGVAFVVDISERKEAEKQREIFLGHELKTPLAAIKGFSQLLLKRLERSADKETLSYLRRIGGKVDGLTQLISDLTDLTRLRAGQLEFREEVFDFDALIKDVVADFQAMTSSHRVVLEGKTNRLVLADKARISQIALNLLSNAVKYSPWAEEVIVRLSHDKNKLAISVQDFGFGIPSVDQERIFQPFFRSAISKNEVSGVGLGLYISQQIAKHYHGSFSLKSSVGEGSNFTFSLPLKKKTA